MMPLKNGAILPFSGPYQQRETRVQHRLLDLPELLMAIFGPLKKGELARLARVCRVWSSIALDLLWREIPNLATLLKTGYSLRYDPHAYAWDFIESPTDRSWDVVKGYAQRVRTVNAFVAEFSPAVISHLSSRLESGQGSRYLLPNLRGIGGLGVGEDTGLLSLIQMIPRGLQTFRLGCLLDASPAIFTQVLKTIQDTPFDCLTSITICNSPNPTRDSEIVAPVARLQSNLERLDLTGFELSATSLATFGYHPRLTKLYIKHRGESLQTVVELFGVVGASFPKLRHLNVRLDNDLTDEVQVSSLAGISSCWELRRLRVYCGHSENLTSQMVLEMGRWWPSMEVFQIGGNSHEAGRACAPLSLLPDIVQVWASTLQSLFIAFSLTDQLLPVPESNHLKFHNLEFIVFPGPIPHHRRVDTAEFLATLTTQPFHVRENGRLARQSSRWNEVSRLIQKVHQKHESEARND